MDKHDIFISYSRRDKIKVDKIIEILINNGYTVWVDVDGIESGEAFRANIVDAIENSSIVIFFSSKSSNISKWTTKEISLAVEFAKYIIPIKFDSTRYNKSILFDLIDLDYIEMSENRLMDVSTQKLLKTVRSKIGKKETPEERKGKDSLLTSDINSSDNKYNRKSIQLDIKNLRESIAKCWVSRNNIINTMLLLYTLLALVGLGSTTILGFAIWPASILGLYGIFLLICNKKDGIPCIAGAALLWTLAEAYITAPSVPIFRFFQEGNILIVWSPLTLTILTVMALFIRKDGVAWWRRCKKISICGTVLLTIAGIFYIWSIYFDTVTKLGLPPNIRHYINRIFG